MPVPHTHAFEPYGPNRSELVPRTPFSQRFGRCRCGLNERRRYRSGTLFEIRFSFDGGLNWIDPMAFLQAKPLPVQLCSCEGKEPRCRRCRGLGILDEDGMVYV